MELADNALTPGIYNALREAVGWSAYPVSQAQSALKARALNVVAFSEEGPVAMGSMIGDGIYYLLVDIVVAPRCQGTGIGTAIIERLIQTARNSLSAGERCSVQLVAAQGKEAFYKKFGFAEIPDRKSGHGMQLALNR